MLQALTHRGKIGKEEVLFSRENRTSWSCWADSNRRPHPYQPIFDDFYNNFRLFLVVFVPNNVVSRTFEKCSLRCFHICLWWNCGQAAILRIRPLIVRNHIRCISISYSPEFFYFIYRCKRSKIMRILSSPHFFFFRKERIRVIMIVLSLSS